MKRYCTVCHKIHSGRCERKRIYRGARNSQADRFRNTQGWRRKAGAIIQRDYNCCRVCACAGVICTQGLSVHHIVPLSADYDKRLDNDNLITLCRYHHEQADRGALSARELKKLALADFSPEDIPPLPYFR